MSFRGPSCPVPYFPSPFTSSHRPTLHPWPCSAIPGLRSSHARPSSRPVGLPSLPVHVLPQSLRPAPPLGSLPRAALALKVREGAGFVRRDRADSAVEGKMGARTECRCREARARYLLGVCCRGGGGSGKRGRGKGGGGGKVCGLLRAYVWSYVQLRLRGERGGR